MRRVRRPLLRPRPAPWHPRGCGWVPARGSRAPPAAEPARPGCPPERGDAASARAPRASVSSPRARVRRFAPAGHRSRPPPATGPLRGGSLQAKGIFLWILLEASAPGWREAAEGPPGRVPAPARKVGARRDPREPRPAARGAAARTPHGGRPTRAELPARAAASRPSTHRRVWTGPALSRCHRPAAPALKSEPGSLPPLPRYLLGGAGSASKLRGIWLKIQAPSAPLGLRLGLGLGLGRPDPAPARPPALQPASR